MRGEGGAYRPARRSECPRGPHHPRGHPQKNVHGSQGPWQSPPPAHPGAEPLMQLSSSVLRAEERPLRCAHGLLRSTVAGNTPLGCSRRRWGEDDCPLPWGHKSLTLGNAQARHRASSCLRACPALLDNPRAPSSEGCRACPARGPFLSLPGIKIASRQPGHQQLPSIFVCREEECVGASAWGRGHGGQQQLRGQLNCQGGEGLRSRVDEEGSVTHLSCAASPPSRPTPLSW